MKVLKKIKNPYLVKFLKDYFPSIFTIVFGYATYGLFVMVGATNLANVIIGFGIFGVLLAILVDIVHYVKKGEIDV